MAVVGVFDKENVCRNRVVVNLDDDGNVVDFAPDDGMTMQIENPASPFHLVLPSQPQDVG